MRKRPIMVLAVLIFVGGASLVAYPYVSDFFYKRAQAQVSWNQDQAVSSLHQEDLSTQKQDAYDYNDRLLAGKTVVTDPFDPSQKAVSEGEYGSLLNVLGDGMMGSISIPKLGLDRVPIYHGTDDEVLQKGTGHLQGTSLPIGGDSSHSVLAGHTGLPSVRIFDGLDRLAVGDYFVIQVLGEDHAYRVYSVETVLPEETSSLVIEPGRDLCTLVTCTPYGVNTHRLLVHAERCDVPQEWIDLQSRPASLNGLIRNVQENSLLVYSLMGLAVAVGVGIGIFVLRRRKGTSGDVASKVVDDGRRGRHFRS
ncbi:hypothetical protein HMPREF1008_01108 [Olsenella sp. oral taxon 809 str. F0356]|nr:hypothetical protein HMPREF1008_01108 [Olsenella sp. oral taxon 809 str. F0356]